MADAKAVVAKAAAAATAKAQIKKSKAPATATPGVPNAGGHAQERARVAIKAKRERWD